MNKQQATTELVESCTPRLLANVIVQALAAAGSIEQWDSETIEYVLEPLMRAAAQAGLPSISDTEAWQEINQ